jgi:hypothetical protein
MDIWKSVVDLNNAGVALLLQNKVRAALPLFIESLTRIRTIMSAQQQGPGSTAPTQRFQHHDATHALYNLQDEHSFVWNEVFTISYRDNDCLVFESESQILYTSMIIFNIGLIYHRQSKLGKPSCLAKAERLYQMVATLLGCDSSYNQGTAVIVKLAALNNLSLIQYEQTNFDASRRGFEQLVRAANSATHLPPPASLVDVNSMLLNALILTSSYCCQPSAAAA